MKLTASARKKIPASKFAGPGRSFPINDPTHARMAISGATRSENAGNISASEADSIKAAVEALVKSGAYLRGADLSGANLRGAYLSGAYNIIHLGCPNGWANAFAWLKAGVLMVQVGCRSKTLAKGREYWVGKENRREVMAALDYAEAVAKSRGWEIAP